MMNALAGGGDEQEQMIQQTAHVEIADHHAPSETALIYAVRYIPGRSLQRLRRRGNADGSLRP